MIRRTLLSTFATVALCFSTLARAQGAPPPPAAPPAPPQPAPAAPPVERGYHTHDGFFLQMDLGFGAMSSKASQSGTDLELSGGAAEFSLVLGGAITHNFILGGHFWGVSVPSPEAKLNGQSLGSASDTTLSLSAFGLNLTYYFMPINLYISATPSIGSLSVESGGNRAKTDSGFAIRLAVGKEWWVSTNWGLGLNVQYAHSSNKDQGTNPPTWGTNWFGAAFSATYN